LEKSDVGRYNNDNNGGSVLRRAAFWFKEHPMRKLALLIACGYLAVGAAPAQAQFSGGSNFPGGGFGASNAGGGQGGGGSFGGGGQGGGGQGGSSQQSGDTGVGQLSGTERYLRDNRQPGQFVGNDSGEANGFIGALSANGGAATGARGMAGMTGLGGMMGMGGIGGAGGMMGLGMTGLGGMGGIGGLGGRMGLGGMSSLGGLGGMGRGGMMSRGGMMGMGGMMGGRTVGGFFPNTQNGGGAAAIRNTVSLGFTPPAPAPNAADSRLTGLLRRSPRIQQVTPIEVELRGRTAILRGTVATDHDRDLARLAVLLEPGVAQVRNELAVAGQRGEALPSPPPPPSIP
jgi:hypothetical protein